jgi:thiamine biosynthesis lipoprotein
MASPCEVLVDSADPDEAARLGRLAEAEARRIEGKYSRYRPDSLLSAINRSDGQPVAVDAETAALLDYAAECHRLSGGLFDITSGVLRRLWTFDGSDRLPDAAAIAALRPLLGWERVRRGDGWIALPPGMEIDFGGLGKEYAVDRALLLAAAETDAPLLVNFGGDLRVSGPRRDGTPWRVAIEAVDAGAAAPAMLEIREGALTTSGDSRRFLVKDGVRYGHILDPRSGWPVAGAPRSVTVAAGTCMEAGILSTLAMAKGPDAEQFLRDEKIVAWVIR